MNHILLMTSAGSLLFLGELLMERVMGKRMNLKYQYRMLIMVMFTYLVPWIWMRGVYGAIGVPCSITLPYWIPFVKDSAVEVSGGLMMEDAVFHTSKGLVVTSGYSFQLLMRGFWTASALFAMALRSMLYFSNRHRLLKCARSCEADVPEELIMRLKKELHIKCRVKVVRIYTEKGSFTLGALRPVVFLQNGLKADELETILRHEFVHIARGDLMVKMLAQLVCCLHWFNPFAYWLNRRLESVGEKACDEIVTRDMAEDDKVSYAFLIVQSMRAPEKVSKKKWALFGSSFSSNGKKVEERVRAIMETRKSKTWEKIVLAGVFALLVFADSLSAMAYPLTFDVSGPVEYVDAAAQGEFYLVQEGDEGCLVDAEVPILYDEQIITADGEILPAQGQGRVICIFHKWEDGKVQSHVKNDNGSCTVTTYECTYCTVCGKVKLGEIISTNTYNPCPHGGD